MAEKLGVRVLELVPAPRRAAVTSRSPRRRRGAADTATADAGAAQPVDIALILHTSGTTSRPKIVPLTQANVCASAGNVARTLALAAGDRALNIMPLFHIHGLIAGLLAPLSAGSTSTARPASTR